MTEFRDYYEYVINQVKGIGIIDILDILIVALLLYACFKFVRGRRAGKLIVGITFLAVLLAVSDFVEMNTLNFILKNLFSMGLVAIVIVFQPELRSALEKVGGDPLKNIKGKMNAEDSDLMRHTISEVSVAAESLSNTRTGALIVFERTTPLGDYIRTGTIVDGVTSSFLIGNIFFHNAPLHDGAVIIRDGRVHSAGCFLPLSDNNEIIKELGTRHRAAIGMSENSDAVVLVVSEENGIISVAVDGKLKRNFNQQTLEQYLLKLLVREEKKNVASTVKKKFRRKKGGSEDDK